MTPLPFFCLDRKVSFLWFIKLSEREFVYCTSNHSLWKVLKYFELLGSFEACSKLTSGFIYYQVQSEKGIISNRHTSGKQYIIYIDADLIMFLYDNVSDVQYVNLFCLLVS